jgi:hypothetical protein
MTLTPALTPAGAGAASAGSPNGAGQDGGDHGTLAEVRHAVGAIGGGFAMACPTAAVSPG